MNKNILLAVILSVSFLFLWSVFMVPRLAPPPPQPTPPAQVAPQADPGKPAELVSAHRGQPAAPDAILRDEHNEIIFSPQGGGIRQWRLKLKGEEVNLVAAPDTEPLPLASGTDSLFKMTSQPGQLVMQGTLANGLRLTKTLALSPAGFLHTLSFRFDNPFSQPVDLKNWEWGWGPGLGTTTSEHKENARLTRALQMGKLKAHALKAGTYSDAGEWVGIDNRYFMVAFLPSGDADPHVVVSGTKDQTRVVLQHDLTVPARGLAVLHYEIYVGPKGYTQLKRYNKNLEEGVDFGLFSALGKLILSAIYRLQKWTGNYGWAIVILTLILQVLILPLTIKNFKSMLAMKRIQPQIAALQKQYKSDPKRLNIEMMNLYKKTGTNPFGGCLPMLLQLPIFWALFTTLRNAYELRGTPWIGWIRDLSAADPYHILPIIMGGSMFLQQRLSGAVTDPTQRQMMFIMPIMFTVMFFNFPSGLVLYWLTNNLATIAIQWFFQRTQQRSPVEVVR